MDATFINLGPFSVRTFTALIAATALIGLAAVTVAGYFYDRNRVTRRALLRWFDAGLGALIGGVIGARLLHVVFAWGYFADHLAEIPNLRAGGLSWHGALYGGLIGLALAARWRDVPFHPLADALALAWPVGVMAAWAGCRASACGYGAEVWTLADFPAWAVSESPDVFGVVAPRYNVQVFGVGLGAILLAVALLIALFGWLRGYRLWLVLALTGAGMFVLGFFRGEFAPSPLPNISRDQLLDLSVIALSVIAASGTRLYARASDN